MQPIRTTTFISTRVAAVKASAAKIIPTAIFLRGLKDTDMSLALASRALTLHRSELYDFVMCVGSHKVDFNINFSYRADKALILMWRFNPSLSMYRFQNYFYIYFFLNLYFSPEVQRLLPACRVCSRRCPLLTWCWFCKGQRVDRWRGQRWARGGESAGRSASIRQRGGGQPPVKWPHKAKRELIKPQRSDFAKCH